MANGLTQEERQDILARIAEMRKLVKDKPELASQLAQRLPSILQALQSDVVIPPETIIKEPKIEPIQDKVAEQPVFETKESKTPKIGFQESPAVSTAVEVLPPGPKPREPFSREFLEPVTAEPSRPVESPFLQLAEQELDLAPAIREESLTFPQRIGEFAADKRDVLTAGMSQSTPGLVYQVLRGDQIEFDEPEGFVDKLIFTVGEFAPDTPIFFAGTITGGGLGGLALTAGTKQALKVSLRQTVKNIIKAQGKEFTAKEVAKTLASKEVRSQLKYRALLSASKGAGAFGTQTAVKDIFQQRSETGTLDLGAHAKNVGIAIGEGFIFGPIVDGGFVLGGTVLDGITAPLRKKAAGLVEQMVLDFSKNPVIRTATRDPGRAAAKRARFIDQEAKDISRKISALEVKEGALQKKAVKDIVKARQIGELKSDAPLRMQTLIGEELARPNPLKSVTKTTEQIRRSVEKRRRLEGERAAIYDSFELKNLEAAKDAFEGATFRQSGKNLPVFRESVQLTGDVVPLETMRAMRNARDLPGGLAQVSTFFKDVNRVAEYGDRGSLRGRLKMELNEPIENALVKRTVEVTSTIEELEGIMNNASIRPMSKLLNAIGNKVGAFRDTAIRHERLFKFAEGRALTKEEQKLITPEEKELVKFIRSKYDDFLGRINQERAAVNKDPIKARKDYVTHIKQLNVLSDLGVEWGEMSAGKISTLLKGPKFRFEKRREGGEFDTDIISAFFAYLHPAMNQIHFLQPGAQVRSRVKFLPDNLKKYYTSWLNEAVFNEKTATDAFVDSWIGGTSNAIGALSARYSRGAIIGNLSTAALQVSTFPLNAALTDMSSAARGLSAMMRREGQEFAHKWSKQVKIRNAELDIPKAGLRKFERWLGYLNKTLDEQMVTHMFLSSYHHGKKTFNFGHEAAVRYADIMAGKSQAIYNRLFTPSILRVKTTRPFTNFQTFTFNMFNVITSDLARKSEREGINSAIADATKIAASMVVSNFVYEDVFGLPTPFELQSLIPLSEQFTGVVLGKEFQRFGAVPPIRALNGIGKTMLATEQMLWGGITGDRAELQRAERNYGKAFKDLKQATPFIGPGANQLRKTIEGALAIEKGFVKVGNKKAPIIGGPEMARALLFGPFRTRRANQLFEERR